MEDLSYIEEIKSGASGEPLKGVFSLVLNRATKLNALSKDLVESLIENLSKLNKMAETRELRVLILKSTAAPKAFCAGADLEERKSMGVGQIRNTLDEYRKITTALERMTAVTIAVIDGVAFGGGFELALSCDFRVASEKSLMGLTELRLGIIPGAGGTQRLTKIVGFSKAKELIFAARKLSAQEAERLGILSFVGADPTSLALKLAYEFVEAAPLALTAAKEAIDGGRLLDTDAALDFERACYEKVLNSEDRVEGLKAFAEKRKAVFKGR